MEISIVPEENPEVWRTSVDELMTIFRDGLLALIPIMDKAHIPYEEETRYDDFDAIATVLFDQIVSNSIKWAFADSDEIEIPAYGFEFDSEKHTAFIEVSFGSNQGQYVFQDFFSERKSFDTVKCYPLGKTQILFSAETAYVSLKECRFRLKYKKEKEFNSASALTVLL